MAADPDFSQKFSALKAAAEQQRGPKHSSDLRLALNDLADLSDLSDIDDAAIAGLIPELSSPTGAGLLAVWLGGRVEGGSDPDRTCRPIAEAFLKWSRTIETNPEDGGDADGGHRQSDQATIAGMRLLGRALARLSDLRRWLNGISGWSHRPNGVADGRPQPDQETIAGMQLLGQALVAHLARSQHLRRWFTEADEIYSELLRVEHHSIGACWLLTLLRQRSGKIVVLNAKHKNGVVVRYNNIATCFHLFTLLQGALAEVMPDAQEVSEDLLDIARGNQRGDSYDTAWWHYGQAHAAEPSLGASVWGEAGPDSISSVDGHQVLLLWPPILQSRTWSGFFSPILMASLPSVEVMEVLSSAEVEAWWVRLGLASTTGA